jgi:hypothetical protein
MFKCNNKKLNWYLDRGLAVVIENNPPTIKLNFTPNGLGNHNKSYGLGKMENLCVNCGSKNHLTRHHIVPFCYRKYFPLEIKSHNFHDVLPMCVDCHNKYERKADRLKEDFAIIYNAPINGEIIGGKSTTKYIKMAITLLTIDSIPKNRIIELRNKIKLHFDIKRLSTTRIKKISEMKINTRVITHGKIVINKISNLQEFIEIWRNHFIENNYCNHLPENWNIKQKI